MNDDLLAGRTPCAKGDGFTIRDLCKVLLRAKVTKMDLDKISRLTFRDYQLTTDRIISQFGKTRLDSDLVADDFTAFRASIAETGGVVALGRPGILSKLSFFMLYFRNNWQWRRLIRVC